MAGSGVTPDENVPEETSTRDAFCFLSEDRVQFMFWHEVFLKEHFNLISSLNSKEQSAALRG